MPKHARFRPTKCAEGWRINVPASVTGRGKRERYFFSSRGEAREKSEELKEAYKEHGAQAHAISPSLTDMAVRCAAKLEPYGHTLESATNAFLRILDAQGASIPLCEAADHWIAAKAAADCREATLKSYRYTIKRLDALADKLICDVTAQDVEEAITSKPTSFEMHRRNARALFLFAAKRGWCKEGVLKAIEPRKARAKEIETLTPAQVRKILKAAEKNYPETVAAFAIALFAGLRSKELERLTWRDIHDDGIEVASSTSKRGKRRFIEMNDTLKAWLIGRRQDDDFLVIPGSWREKGAAVRRMAGFRVSARILKKPIELPKDAPAWPQNGIRHTHASAAVRSGKNVDDLIFEFGHTGDVEMLRNHYVGAYRPKEAVAFWSIGPNGTKIPTTRAA
jgi:integrase